MQRYSLVVISSILLVSQAAAIAQTSFRQASIVANQTTVDLNDTQYFRPSNPSAPRSPHTTTGTRQGGCFAGDVTPQILAPSKFVGLTATSQPTLTWLLPDDQPVPVELSLYELAAEVTPDPTDIYDTKYLETVAYQPGLNQFLLPQELALEPNKRYMWQLVLYCNPNRPSSALIYEAELEYMPMGASTQTELATAPSNVEKAKVFAGAGYWYDAIAVLGAGQQTDTAEMRTNLFNDLTLLENSMADEN